MAEDRGEKVAGVGGLRLDVGRVDVELGDLDRQAELAETVEHFDNARRGRGTAAEMPLFTHAPDRCALLLEELDRVIVIPAGGTRAASVEHDVVVVVKFHLRRPAVRGFEPLDHGLASEHVDHIVVRVTLVDHVPFRDALAEHGGLVGDVVEDGLTEFRRIVPEVLEERRHARPRGPDHDVSARGDVVGLHPVERGEHMFAALEAFRRLVDPVVPLDVVLKDGFVEIFLQCFAVTFVVGRVAADDPVGPDGRAEAESVPLHPHLDFGPGHGPALRIGDFDPQIGLADFFDAGFGLRAPGCAGFVALVAGIGLGQVGRVDVGSVIEQFDPADLKGLGRVAHAQAQLHFAGCRVAVGPEGDADGGPFGSDGQIPLQILGVRFLAAFDDDGDEGFAGFLPALDAARGELGVKGVALLDRPGGRGLHAHIIGEGRGLDRLDTDRIVEVPAFDRDHGEDSAFDGFAGRLERLRARGQQRTGRRQGVAGNRQPDGGDDRKDGFHVHGMVVMSTS